MRKTKIVCTIGPASSKEEILLDKEADLQLWETICRKKIKEAWEEYVQVHPEAAEK